MRKTILALILLLLTSNLMANDVNQNSFTKLDMYTSKISINAFIGFSIPKGKVFDIESESFLLTAVYEDGKTYTERPEHIGLLTGFNIDYAPLKIRLSKNFYLMGSFRFLYIYNKISQSITVGDGQKYKKNEWSNNFMTYHIPQMGPVLSLFLTIPADKEKTEYASTFSIDFFMTGGAILGGEIYPFITIRDFYNLEKTTFTKFSGVSITSGIGLNTYAFCLNMIGFNFFYTRDYIKFAEPIYTDLGKNIIVDKYNFVFTTGFHF